MNFLLAHRNGAFFIIAHKEKARLFWLLCFDDGGVERAREGEEMTRASQEINHSFGF